jgi:tetratricopeptide (TPR) repeat protein
MSLARILRKRARFQVLACAAIAALAAVCSGCHDPSSRGTPEAQLHQKRGLELVKDEKFAEAVQEFDLAVRIDKDFALAYADRGIAKHKLDRDEDAVKDCEGALKIDPLVADAYNFLGEIYYDQRRDDVSEDSYKKAIEIFPKYDEALFNLGRLYERRSELDKALAQYEAACAENPRFTEAHVAAGWLYLKNGVFKDANDHFLLALEHDPKNPLAHFGLGVIAKKQEQWEEAVKRHKLALDGCRADDKAMRADIQRSLNETYAKSPPRVAQTLIDLSRDLMAVTQTAKRQSSLEEALSYLDAAGKIDPKNTGVYVLRAQVDIDLKRPDDAMKDVKNGLAVAPRDRDVRFMGAVVSMAIASASKGELAAARWKDAEVALRELRREDPKSSKFHQYLGVCYFKERQYRRAEREWKEALETIGDEPAIVAQLNANLLEIYKTPGIKKANELNDDGVKKMRSGSLKDLNEALDLFKEALVLDGQFAVAYANEAAVLVQLGDPKLARVKAQDAIARDPDLGRAYNQLGIINANERKLEDARKNFIEAAACDARDPEPHYNLGNVLLDLKREQDALDEWNLAIQIDPTHFRSYYALGLYYSSKDALETAMTNLKLAIRESDKAASPFVLARVALAKILIKQHKTGEAMATLQAADDIDDKVPEIWAVYAEAWELSSERTKALNAWLNAAARFGAQTPPAYFKQVDAARRAVALDDKSPDAHNDLGLALMGIGSYVDALAELKRADDLEPNELKHRFNMGLCYLRKGGEHSKANAAACFRDVFAANAQFPQPFELYGNLFQCGASDNPITRREALDALERALKLETDLDRKQLIQQKIDEIQRCND